jgi:hypothetical protein
VPKTKTLLGLLSLCLFACSDRPKPTGLTVGQADAAAAVAPPDAGPADLSKCTGCQNAAQGAWTFEGIYKDAACTEPLAQSATAACGAIAPLGQVSLTYVDEVGLRKAAEVATVTLAEQIPPEATRYRKSDKKCVPFNEGGMAITPAACAGSKVCRNQAGALACTECRTFANGCPDFAETRTYASVTDPGLKAKAGGGGGNAGRLSQCCTALAAEARRLGASPEAGLLNSAAVQCSALVAAAGPNGNAPELGVLRNALAGRPLPAVCAGF